MAGLGAYGGAGLGGSLAQAGMQAAVAPELAAANAQLGALTPAQISEFQAASGPVVSGPVFEAQQAAQQAAQKMAQQQASYGTSSLMDKLGTMGQGVKTLGTGEGWSNLASNAGGPMSLAKYGISAAAPAIEDASRTEAPPPMQTDKDMGQRYTYSAGQKEGPYTASPTGVEQSYFSPQYQKISNQQAQNIFGFADGGQVPAPGTPTQYSYDPMAQIFNKIDSMPSDDQTRQATEHKPQQGGGRGPTANSNNEGDAPGNSFGDALGISSGDIGGMIGRGIMGLALPGPLGMLAGIAMNAMNSNGQGFASGVGPSPGVGEGASSSTGSGNQGAKAGAIAAGTGNAGIGPGPGAGNAAGTPGVGASGYAAGGVSDAYNLGGYSDGGRLLRGPGDGVSDSIPATIGHKQPARLADGEFVVPARIVSELGNGSTEAGARKLYAMLDRVQSARSKTVGKGKIAKNSRAEQYLPA
jgi:hypothetical protein